MHLLFYFVLLLCSLSFEQAESSEKTQTPTKVALITGASRGIGLATAEQLAKNGYAVYATIRNHDACPASKNKNIHFELLDVTNAISIRETVCKIIEREGHLDILINNAGYALGGPLECLSIQDAQEQMDVNFFGVIRTCHEVLPYMRKQKSGHIINVSSEQGVYGLPYGSLYTASKAALESLSEALSLEVLPWNIVVSIVEPGLVATNFTVKLGSRQLEQDPYQKIRQKIEESLQEKREPSEHCQSPEEIAQFLQNVIEDPKPQLRYQTSKAAEETVSKTLKDISGKEYSSRMKSLIIDAYKDAWSSD